MADSPSGTLSIHDWKRIGELFLQGAGVFVLQWLIQEIPHISFGNFQPEATVVLLVLTELAKRSIQGPDGPISPPTA